MAQTSGRRSRRTVGLRVASVLTMGAIVVGCSDPATPARSAADRSTTTAASASATTTTAPADRPGTTPAATGAAAPEVGACIEPLTFRIAEGPVLPAAVPCAEAHGGEVVAVYDAATASYPALTSTLRGIDDAQTSCYGEGDDPGDFDAFAGDNRLESPAYGSVEAGRHPAWLVSSLEATIFVPSPAAWNRGARWVVCAAVLKNSTRAFSQYDGSARGVRVPEKMRSAFAWCRTASGANGEFDVVACTDSHSAEQVSSFSIDSADAPYPGSDRIDALAGDLCPGLTRIATAGRFTEDTEAFGVSWTYPGESDWADGDRIGRCLITSLDGVTTGRYGDPPSN